VAKLLAAPPATPGEWEVLRPLVVEWLCGEWPSASRWTADPQWTQHDGYRQQELRLSDRRDAARARLLVPAAHVGRDRGVLYFPADASDGMGEALCRVGFVVMVVEPAAADLVASVPYFRERLEVDPDRVAVLAAPDRWQVAWREAAWDDNVAAVATVGAPPADDLPAAALLSAIAPLPHRLWAAPAEPSRQPAEGATALLAAPRHIYRLYDLESSFTVDRSFDGRWSPESDTWQAVRDWLRAEL